MNNNLNLMQETPAPTAAAITPQNVQLAIDNLDGMERSMKAMHTASALPENEPFAHVLLERVSEVYEIAKSMNSRSPV